MGGNKMYKSIVDQHRIQNEEKDKNEKNGREYS